MAKLTPADYDRWDGKTCIRVTSGPKPAKKPAAPKPSGQKKGK